MVLRAAEGTYAADMWSGRVASILAALLLIAGAALLTACRGPIAEPPPRGAVPAPDAEIGRAVGTLLVEVHGDPTWQGLVRGALCGDRAEWLGDGPYGHGATGEYRDGRALLRFEQVPVGAWPLKVHLDLDGDGRLARGRFGMPAEPIGFGNDAPPRFGPPSMAAATIAIEAGENRTSVRLIGEAPGVSILDAQ
jgi:uncharacterized protein (DUF2141 family)